MNVRKTSVCPTVFSANNQVEDDMVQEEVPDIVPHFQRVNISGEDITGNNSYILIPFMLNINSLITVQDTLLKIYSSPRLCFRKQLL